MTRPTIPALEELKSVDQWVAFSDAKVPIGKNGHACSVKDPRSWLTFNEALDVRRRYSCKGVGFIFTPQDPYVGADLDHCIVAGVLTEQAKEIVEALGTYTEVSPSGDGLHLICKVDAPLTRSGFRKPGLEIYHDSRYFTVTGNHLPQTPTEICDCSEALKSILSDFGPQGEPSETKASYEASDVSDWLSEALHFIPADDYNTFFRVGTAIKSELGEPGFIHFNDWASKSHKYMGAEWTYRKWTKLPANSEISAGTIVWIAEQHGFDLQSARYKLPDGALEDAEKAAKSMLASIQDSTETDKGFRLEWIAYSEAYLDRSEFEPDYVDPGFIGPSDIVLIAGAPKSKKSLLCLDMCRNFALGKPWLDTFPRHPMTTYYMQLELKADKMRQRLHMCELTQDDVEKLDQRFFYTPKFSAVLSSAFLDHLVETTSEMPRPELIVVDPIANLFSGKSENDNREMLDFIRQLQLMRNLLNPDAALVLVHHASKKSRQERDEDPFNAFRGASALRGIYDTGIYIDIKTARGIELTRLHRELRNGPPMPTLELEFADGRFHLVDPDEIKIDIKLHIAQLAESSKLVTSTQLAEHIAKVENDITTRFAGFAIAAEKKSSDIYTYVSQDHHIIPDSPKRSHGWIVYPGLRFQNSKGSHTF